MSFLKYLLSNWLGGGMGKHGGYNKHGYSGYSKHGNKQGYGYDPSMSQPNQNMNTTNTCPKCTRPNPDNARFCQQCGTSLGPTNCTSCNQPLESGTKFCSQCGKAQ